MRAGEEGSKNIVSATQTGDHKIFVEGRLEGSGVRDTKNCIGSLDAVRSAEPWFRLAGDREAVIEIATDANIEEPVPCLDLILGIQGQLFDIGMADEVVLPTAASQIVRQ